MKRAFLFVGQGQQYPEMGVDLCLKYPEVHKIYELAHDILGYNLLELSADQLMDSRYIQTSLYVLGHSIDVLLKGGGVNPDYVSGLSLGEYNALTSASTISFEDGLKIIQQRAAIMSTAFETGETKMAACLKTDTLTLKTALKGSDVEICNYNSPTNHVIGGNSKAMDAMLIKLKEQKIMAIPLKMSTVSHSPLLSQASMKLKDVLLKYDYKKPSIPFLNNTQAKVQEDNFIESLSIQISKPTHMGAIIQKLHQDGVTHFIEVGPKGSLSRLVKEICGLEITIDNVYDVKTLEEVIHA